MSIENCTYNGGKMCQRIGECYKGALLKSQAEEGGTISHDSSPDSFEPGPYMTLSQWLGLVAQITAHIDQCGERETVEAQIQEWDAIKRDPENGFLKDTGSSTLPSGWYTGSESK